MRYTIGDRKKFFAGAVILLAVGFGFFIVYTNIVILSYRKNIAYRLSHIPTTTVAMVFGGGMKPDGSMSEMAEERMKIGIDLYKKGIAEKLLITSDDGAFRVNEVYEMGRYAVAHGVDQNDLTLDGHGYRTYESCLRAGNFFKFKKAIAVSQEFHLPRIAFLCAHFDVQITGVPAHFPADWYGKTRNFIRETLSRTKNWLDINIFPPPSPVQDALRNAD